MTKFKQITLLSFVLLIGILWFCIQDKISNWWVIFPILIWLIFTIYGVFEIRFNYFLSALNKGNEKQKKIIALTFDDGPTEITPRILEILQRYNAKATFFCIGQQIEKFPEILKEQANHGHTIGNHTFHHSSKIGFYSSDHVKKEIFSTNQLIEKVIQKKTRLFRLPFGVTNPHIAKAIQQTNHLVIGWSIRSLDTMISDEEQLYRRIVAQIKPGAILLMHDTTDKTANVLEQLFVFLQKENYQVVPLDELLKIDVYEN